MSDAAVESLSLVSPLTLAFQSLSGSSAKKRGHICGDLSPPPLSQTGRAKERTKLGHFGKA